jgi:hypothetical protein
VIKEVVMGAALVVTLVTGADYVVRAIRMSKTPRAKASPGEPPPSAPPDVRMGRPDRKNGDRMTPPRTD